MFSFSELRRTTRDHHFCQGNRWQRHHPGYKSVDCLNADNFCPYGEKNCIFSHGPGDQPPPKRQAAAVSSKVRRQGKSGKSKSAALFL